MSTRVMRYIHIISGFIWFLTPLTAQEKDTDTSVAGIYRSYQDFMSGTLSYSVNCSMEKQKIRFHDLMQKPFVDVFHKGEKIRLFKGELFGYQDCHGNMFRFYCNREYQLAEIRGIGIYFMEEDIPYGTSFIRERIFYFTATPDGPLFPLTFQNLTRTFSGNQKFLQLLNTEIKKESDLCFYDYEHGTFKINYLYTLSQ